MDPTPLDDARAVRIRERAARLGYVVKRWRDDPDKLSIFQGGDLVEVRPDGARLSIEEVDRWLAAHDPPIPVPSAGTSGTPSPDRSSVAYEMQFGKYRGTPINSPSIPTGYLQWVRDNIKDLRTATRDAIAGEIARRDAEKSTSTPATSPPPSTTASLNGGECATCGLPGSPTRPLIHADCVEGGLP
jgi:hypothetical protein